MSVGNLAVVIPDVAERMMFYHPFVHQITSLFSGGGTFLIIIVIIVVVIITRL